MPKKGLIERLNEGIVIGDGGFVFALEKRGYVKAGPWTPEAVVEHPEAVRQLHREFLRAGADVMQAFTFYASDDKLDNRGNEMSSKHGGASINAAACKLARDVANEGDALMAGSFSQTPTYLTTRDEEKTKAEFRKQIKVFGENKVDFMIVEYFEHVEEIEWAIQVALESKVPVVSTMCINSEGDLHGVSVEECGLRMAKAGAHVIGINCHFDPFMVLDGVKRMKSAVDKEGIKGLHFITQPLGFHTPDASKQGFIDLPEFPFGLEPRIVTRWDIQRYAREAYNIGIRYIGGCCGFEPYHIRAISEELAKEHGRFPKGSEKHGLWGEALRMHTKPWVRARANRSHWENLKPASGRPYCPALSKSDAWGVTAGKEELGQHKSATTEDEQRVVESRAQRG